MLSAEDLILVMDDIDNLVVKVETKRQCLKMNEVYSHDMDVVCDEDTTEHTCIKVPNDTFSNDKIIENFSSSDQFLPVKNESVELDKK